MSKHRRESWRYELSELWEHVVREGKDGYVAWGLKSKEDACLIAAAPELHEALKWVLKEGYANEAVDCGDHCSNACMWCMVRNAVAKAEGREP